MCGNTGGMMGGGMSPRFQQPRAAFQPQGFQGMAKPFGMPQQPMTGDPSPSDPSNFGGFAPPSNNGAFPPTGGPTPNEQFSQPRMAMTGGLTPRSQFAPPPPMPFQTQRPQMSGLPQGMGERSLFGQAKPLNIPGPPSPVPGGGTLPPPPNFPPPPGGPPPLTPPGTTPPGTPPPGTPPPNNGFLPDYVYNQVGNVRQASAAPGDNSEATAGMNTPFIPSLGQWGQYSTPRGTGFTGSRDGYNYFRGHLYGAAPAAGDQNFQNFLNQYGSMPGFRVGG